MVRLGCGLQVVGGGEPLWALLHGLHKARGPFLSKAFTKGVG